MGRKVDVDVAVCPRLGLFPDYIAEMATLACLMHYKLLVYCYNASHQPLTLSLFVNLLGT